MPRPALSASRSFDIIDLLGSFPEREFTLSEIVRATGINVSSCHSILSALTDRGYLARGANRKSYMIGPSLVAVGQAGLKSQPIIERARVAAETLRRELGLAVMLSTVIGEEIVGVLSLEDAQGRDVGLWAGERVPLMAPVGMPFMAWADEKAVAEWIERREAPIDKTLLAQWRRSLELTRQRGYEVTLRTHGGGSSIGSLMAEVALSRQVADYKEQVIRLIRAFDHHMAQPETIEDDQLYDVLMIASPVFDKNGHAAFNLCLGGFSQPIMGAALLQHCNRLMHACLEVMRAERPMTRR